MSKHSHIITVTVGHLSAQKRSSFNCFSRNLNVTVRCSPRYVYIYLNICL